ncbi:MAG: nitronate monooxygenase [Holosporaceae bacterium]|nr:nitronate monooxygenase [Holosporaceae bacterium]
MLNLKPQKFSGAEVLPLIEGGKGIAVSTGHTCGAWAAAGCVGTFSAVNADSYDRNGDIIPQIYHIKSRADRHRKLVEYAISGAVNQAKIAREISGGKGRVHMNVLWEMGGCEEILESVFQKAKGCIHGVVCGAGMPYNLAEIASKFGVYYYPIISSARAFSALFRRAFKKFQDLLGGVVYEDPWLAGGHNGLSNAENPEKPANPYLRIVELRKTMNSFNLLDIPITIAGGVWWLSEWEDYIDNDEVGPVSFQFGTRSLLTTECPVAKLWQPKLMALRRGDVKLTRLSPTGFYSSAINTKMLEKLLERQKRQVKIVEKSSLSVNVLSSTVYLDESQQENIASWISAGYSTAMRTPDDTVVFVAPEQSEAIRKDMSECCGCLSICRFSSWCQHSGTSGKIPDPRTFCIQKTLQRAAHGGDLDDNLVFAGHLAYRFASDPLYNDGFIPSTKQLINRILNGY